MRILYLQYTNPGAYPALGHSSKILVDLGCSVRFLGVCGAGSRALPPPNHPRISTTLLRRSRAGWRQKLHYLVIWGWALWWSIRWRPHWVYASELLCCPIALSLRCLFGTRFIYHEHDTPLGHRKTSNGIPGFPVQVVEATRRWLAGHADVCVVPNEGRAARFRDTTGTQRPIIPVRNYPLRDEALPEWRGDSRLILHYHGNIGPELLPLTVIEALAAVPQFHLRVIGYTTTGHHGFPAELRSAARRYGVASRLELLPAMPRAALFEQARQATLGLCLMPMTSTNPNFQNMAGASNKAFDYLACGLPLLVSDLKEWREMVSDPGFGRACDPRQASSIARALGWFAEHKAEGRSMGELGRHRILTKWNYEKAFAPVLKVAGLAP